MKTLKTEKIEIGIGHTLRLTDENGDFWYPLKYFFKNTLFRYAEMASFRDSSLVKYMQPIPIIFPTSKSQEPRLTWCINEKGLGIILRNAITQKKGKKETMLRNQGLYDACQFFNIERKTPIDTLYSNVTQDLKKYKKLDRICLRNDIDITNNITWKRCSDCNYFFPNNHNYFDLNRHNNTKEKCKKCNGTYFKFKNKEMQTLYDLGGEELVIRYDSCSYISMFKILEEKNIKYVPQCFYEKDVLLQLIYYIRDYKKGAKTNFTLKFIQQFIDIPLPTMKKILGKSIEIGYIVPLNKKYHKTLQPLTTPELRKICRERFDSIVLPKNIPNKEIEPVVGVITKQGLAIICKNPKKLKWARTYTFYTERHKINRTLKAIERMDANEG